MVNLKNYIKKVLSQIDDSIDEVEFDVGVDIKINVNDESGNRVKFIVRRNTDSGSFKKDYLG